MMRAAFVVATCVGLASPALAKECKLFANDQLRQACFDAATEADTAARAADLAKQKAAKAAEAEDVPSAKGGSPEVIAQGVPGATSPCNDNGWGWCKPVDPPKSPALRLPGLSITDKLDSPGSSGKGASFGASTANNQTSIKSSIAAIYKLPEGAIFNGTTASKELGWNGGIGGQWVKDNSTKSKVDGRVVRLFAEGKVPEVPFLAAVRVDGVEDNVSKERSVGVRLNTTAVPSWSQWGTPYNGGTSMPAYDIYLSGGPHLDKILFRYEAPALADAANGALRRDAEH